MAYRIDQGVFYLQKSIFLHGYASIVGAKEGSGPMGMYFDRISDDPYFGASTWEQAEGSLQREAVELAIRKSGFALEQIDSVLSGDLVNQCTSSSYGLRQLQLPFLGVYGACSTMAESLLLASILVESGMGERFAAATSSHFSTAERQFRFPLSYGSQRTPTAQWTCTASGAVVASAEKKEGMPMVTGGVVGRIQDLGVNDANNMGAAMAPAAADTFVRWFMATGTQPKDYDVIITGDLGEIGSMLFRDLTMKQGYDTAPVHEDCGVKMFDREEQDTHAGGSGCGCSGSLLCGYYLPKVEKGKYGRILFGGTGALLSPMLMQQGESIPGICHMVEIRSSRFA